MTTVMFKNLQHESIYLQGARDLLLRLQEEYDMHLIPGVKCKCKPSPYLPNVENAYNWFPMGNIPMRKLLGVALCKTLLQDRESLVRFLSGDYDSLQVKSVCKDKKGKIKSIEVDVV